MFVDRGSRRRPGFDPTGPHGTRWQQLEIQGVQAQGARSVDRQQGVAPVLDRLQESVQRHQQALLIVEGHALVPQGIEFIQYVQMGMELADPIEHLNAFGLPHRQYQRQVLVFQRHRVQVQRTVADEVCAQVFDQRRQRGEGDVVDLAGHQFQHMEMLLDLNQVALIELAQQQVLRSVEDFFDPPGDELRAVVAEAMNPQPGLLPPLRQIVEVIAYAGEQGMGAIKTADQYLVPAVERDLVQGQHQIVPNPGITQRIGALGGHQDIQVAVVLERIDADVYQDQHFAGHTRAQ
ncbi:hypothetical protein D3C84_601890 [compost metagenome]